MIQDVKKIYLCDLTLKPITVLNGVQTDTVSLSRHVKDYDVLTFTVDEYIVVDGKSQDKSLPIILSYQERLKNGFYGKNPRCEMHVLSEKDNSMYEGIAKGFQLATGDIIAYINADDYYFPHAFEFIVSVFEKYPQISWLCGRQCTTDEKGNVTFNMLPFEYQRDYRLLRYPVSQ